MNGLTTELLGRACRTFLALAYPLGADSVPEKKRPFWDIDPGGPLAAFLPPAPAALGVCQVLRAGGRGRRRLRLPPGQPPLRAPKAAGPRLNRRHRLRLRRGPPRRLPAAGGDARRGPPRLRALDRPAEEQPPAQG